ncbi:DUF6807 domain-containing protein [Aeoliella mucimassa]|uniref:Methane oxygenase PmoA n=1 Tax=Aeoliella mucimassa TaxID=2527972 RepID=A0A518AJ78_9BACT|nr:PmoA family protein [Aeoliella mucimassa]QDU54791.1 hypothetical protein Pan181_09740 [Aeoliella mucimassa]
MMRVPCNLYRLAFITLAIGIASPIFAAELGVKLDDDGAAITIDGELFTKYLTDGGNKPILFPVIGPTGEPVTRNYPIKPAVEHEKKDHPHHRSIWFGYEGINGLNFWHEPKELDKLAEHDGKQVHKKFSKIELDGETVLIVAENDYVDRNDKVVAKDERTLRFGVDGDMRWIDYTIKLWSPEGPLVIGDTKEGAFAVRVAGTMKVTEKLGGTILNSHGDVDTEAWGKPASWVDYSGPVKDDVVGIAILAHPSSLKAEPRWHVRDYGLFASNPIGASNYSGGAETGGLERAEGEPIVLRHRIVLHKGNSEQAKIAEVYEAYSKTE